MYEAGGLAGSSTSTSSAIACTGRAGGPSDGIPFLHPGSPHASELRPSQLRIVCVPHVA